ncbi:MAG TPA: SOS response-associated peptidase [Trueperaceae bacterium]|nr:SOS response-associated peptidase [Trueperaceae bacterium]
MCGRYTLYHHEEDLDALFGVAGLAPAERFNIAPSQAVPIVTQRSDGVREALTARWGLVPHWVKDLATFKANLFNARSEGAAEKPSFRDAMRRARCLLPASGFYEWASAEGGKRPYYISRVDGQPLALAGLWSVWRKGEVPVLSCTILTTAPNAVVRPLHDRMPVILDEAEFERWLDPDVDDPAAVEDLLDAYEDDALQAYPVSRAVGNPAFDGPQLIRREPA